MRKTKQAIQGAVRSLTSELDSRFPGLSFETIERPGDGYDAWLRVYLPRARLSERDKIQHEAFELASEFDEKTSVAILPMIREAKEPVHG
jgi:hypothetical protein